MFVDKAPRSGTVFDLLKGLALEDRKSFLGWAFGTAFRAKLGASFWGGRGRFTLVIAYAFRDKRRPFWATL